MVTELWADLRYRFRALFRRADLERELDQELAFHVDQATVKYLAQGLAPNEARRRALIEFGSVENTKEESRERRGTRIVDSMLADLRYAGRGLRAHPIFTAGVVVILGLAIGANTAIFGLANALLFTTLPVPHPEHLYFVSHTTPDGAVDNRFSFPSMDRVRSTANPSLRIAASDFTRLSVTVDGQSEPAEGMLVSGNFFDVFGIRSAAGRLLSADDDAPGRVSVAVLSDRYWRRRLGGASVIGRTIQLDGVPTTIVGILPPSFTGFTVGEAEGDVWLPLSLHARFGLLDHTDVALLARTSGTLGPTTAAEALTAVYRGYLSDSAGSPRRSARVILTSAARGSGSDIGPQLPILVLGGVLLLVVVCANLANLLLSRAMGRTREMAIRLAIGASAGRVTQQLVVESLVLAVLGTLLGGAFASWGADALARYLAADPDALTVHLSLTPAQAPWLFAFIAALTLLITVAFTLLPALSVRDIHLQSTLRAGTPGSRGSRTVLRAGRVLVVAQVALAMLLLLTAGALVSSIRRLAAINPGFERDHVLEFAVYPVLLGYHDESELALYGRLRQRLLGLPGVHGVTMSRTMIARDGRQVCAHVDHAAEAPGDDVFPVGPEFFSTMGIPMEAGREFLDGDRAATTPVAVLSETAARAYFPDGPAVGRALSLIGAVRTPVIVVGIAHDVQTYDMSAGRDLGADACDVYIPIAQSPGRDLGQLRYLIRADHPNALLPSVRTAVLGVEPNLSLFWPATEAELVRQLYGRRASVATLATAFGILALVFAAVGLFALISYAASARTGELGLRLALGARPHNLVAGIVSETLLLTLLGVFVGVGASWAAVGITRGLLLGVQPLNPWAIVTAAGTISLIGSVAAAAPAIRAARLSPLIALRNE